MKINEVIALATAGFSMEQIAKLADLEKAKPEPTPAPAPKSEPAPGFSPDDFLKVLQQNNIINDNQPPKETTDDILAQIINPKQEVK